MIFGNFKDFKMIFVICGIFKDFEDFKRFLGLFW